MAQLIFTRFSSKLSDSYSKTIFVTKDEFCESVEWINSKIKCCVKLYISSFLHLMMLKSHSKHDDEESPSDQNRGSEKIKFSLFDVSGCFFIFPFYFMASLHGLMEANVREICLSFQFQRSIAQFIRWSAHWSSLYFDAWNVVLAQRRITRVWITLRRTGYFMVLSIRILREMFNGDLFLV